MIRMSASVEPFRPALARDLMDGVIERLRQSREVTHNIRAGGRVRELPSTAAVMDIVDGVIASLFPSHLGPAGLKADGIDIFVANSLHSSVARLNDQVRRGLHFDQPGAPPAELKARSQAIVHDFAAALPDIRGRLVADLKAAYARDPSAGSLAEILLCYRSSTAIIHYRLAHALHELGARLVARVISDLAHATTGIDIHPAARIGQGFFIDRGTGVVIGDSVVIGENVTLHQGVTLGASQMESGKAAGARRHPFIGDNVVIHAGATILGHVTIGRNALIGGNVWLTKDVPPGSTVTQAENLNAVSPLS
jgi:serine O-acetyltransferase